MKPLSVDTPASNLTELWWDGDKQDLMTVNGFSGRGSDYEIFRNFCTCIERMPNAPQAKRSLEELQSLFDCSLPLDAAHCHAIWRLTADVLAETNHFRTEIARITGSEPPTADWLNALQPHIQGEPVRLELWQSRQHFTEWRNWSDELETELSGSLSDGSVALTLPSAFEAGMPNFYFANRYLAGETNDRNLWLSQLAFFLFRFCAERRTRAILQSACPAAQIIALAEQLAKLTPLPNLIWIPENGCSEPDFLSLCRTVMQYRKKGKEGEPPILLLLKKEQYK